MWYSVFDSLSDLYVHPGKMQAYDQTVASLYPQASFDVRKHDFQGHNLENKINLISHSLALLKELPLNSAGGGTWKLNSPLKKWCNSAATAYKTRKCSGTEMITMIVSVKFSSEAS